MKKFSIIIPAFNNWVFTESCLKSIFNLTSYKQDDFEVVVVDDDSEDGTSLKITEFINLYPNLKYLLNDRNLGFAATCNHGAAHAVGEHLIFLNNDTRVTQEWDKYLVETIDRDRDIWIVGAKCLYPDGTIQHAGVAFSEFFQYSLYHIYKDVPAFFPLSDYEKDYQCVTGACFIIRKPDFELLNGFDENYFNGFEDVDLCLRIAQLGKRIVYQPRCEIIHYESKSDGRFDAMSNNKAILLERWMQKIRPDEIEHFRNDIEHAKKSGQLRTIKDFSENFHGGEIKIIGKCKLLNSSEINFSPTKSTNRILIPGQKLDMGLQLLVAGEINARSRGNLHLKYMTSQEEYYSDIKCFTKKIFPGQNIFYFTLLSSHLSGELMLEFSKFKDNVSLHKLSLYSFTGHSPRSAPSVAVLYHINSNSSILPISINSLSEDGIKPFLIKILIVTDDKEKLGEIPYLDSNDIEITIKECTYIDLPLIYNEFIEKSGCKYGVSVNNSVNITGNDIKRFVELMETDPSIGIIFKSTQGFLPLNGDYFSQEKKMHNVTLRNLKDIPISFRISAWQDAGRFDTRFCYYFNLDIYMAILSGGNWKGCSLDGIGALSFINQASYPLEIKSRLEDIRALFYAKHARFLLNRLVSQIRLNSSVRPVKFPRQMGYAAFNPHSTVLGSLKVHFNHLIKRIFNKKYSITTNVFGPKLKSKIIPLNKKVVYTIILGDYDDLKEPEVVSMDWDYVCFTNNVKLHSNVWQIVKITCPPGYSDKFYSSLFVTFPFRYLRAYEISVLVGGQISIHCDIEEFVNKVLPKDKSIALMIHPYRDCIYDEAKKVIELKKADKSIVEKQVQRYMKEGLPAHMGMIQTGITVRKHNDQRLRKHCRLWRRQVIKYSHRDQLSFNYVLWKYNLIEPAYFSPNVLNSEFKLHKHKYT